METTSEAEGFLLFLLRGTGRSHWDSRCHGAIYWTYAEFLGRDPFHNECPVHVRRVRTNDWSPPALSGNGPVNTEPFFGSTPSCFIDIGS